jgi:HSP20 family molecular chaperone IbpA
MEKENKCPGTPVDWMELFNTTMTTFEKTTEVQSKIVTEDDSVKVLLAVPGTNKEDFTVEIKARTLFIEHKTDKKDPLVGSFIKSFAVSDGYYKTSSAKASHENGVLTVVIPVKKPKQILVE